MAFVFFAAAQEPPVSPKADAPVDKEKNWKPAEARSEVLKALKEKWINASELVKYNEMISEGKIAELQKDFAAREEDGAGADWPQWLGPERNGSSPEKGLLRKWPKEGPEILWKARIEQGWGSPAVSGNDVYLCGTYLPDKDKETVVCLDLKTGKLKWKYDYPVTVYWKYGVGWADGGVRCTPAVTDKYIYSIGVTGVINCLNRKTGSKIWDLDLGAKIAPGSEKGYVASPAIIDNKLIVFCGDCAREKPFNTSPDWKNIIIAYDADTGKEIWKINEVRSSARRNSEYHTPAMISYGKKDYIVIYADGILRCIDPENGNNIWTFKGFDQRAKGTGISTPIIIEKTNILIVPESGNAVLLNAAGKKPEKKWTQFFDNYANIQNYVYYKGCIYGLGGELTGSSWEAANKAGQYLFCADASDGAIKWKTEKIFRMGDFLCLADGMLFIRSHRRLDLVEAAPGSFNLLSSIENVHNYSDLKSPRALTDFVQPVVAKGKLFLRTPEELICYKIK